MTRGRVISPLEVLTVYERCLPIGSVRLCIYNTRVDRARCNGRLPAEAKDVLEEVKTKVRKALFETDFQREDRLDKEFEALQMGRMTHAEFRSLWEEKTDELMEVGLVRMDESTTVPRLRRKYLSKVSNELRATVLSKVWSLDGKEKPSRKPVT